MAMTHPEFKGKGLLTKIAKKLHNELLHDGFDFLLSPGWCDVYLKLNEAFVFLDVEEDREGSPLLADVVREEICLTHDGPVRDVAEKEKRPTRKLCICA